MNISGTQLLSVSMFLLIPHWLLILGFIKGTRSTILRPDPVRPSYRDTRQVVRRTLYPPMVLLFFSLFIRLDESQ